MQITSATYATEDKKMISAEIDGEQVSIPVCPGNRHYDEIISQNIVIGDYVAPVSVLTNAEKRAVEFAKIDGKMVQILAYEAEGKDASQARAAYLALRADIYAQYPD